MLDAAAREVAMSERMFLAFGVATSITQGDSSSIPTRVIVDEKTRVTGDFGVRIDPRPSAVLPLVDVGVKPQGTFSASGKNWKIARPVDGETNATQVRVWIEPA